MDLAAISAVVSAAIALSSAGIAFFAMRSTRTQMDRKMRFEWDKTVIEWANRAIAALTDAIALSEYGHHLSEAERKADAVRTLSALSTCADQGRLIFENIPLGDPRQPDKPAAYRGHRPPILDCLVLSIYALEIATGTESQGRPGSENIRDQGLWRRSIAQAESPAASIELLWRCRREFVSIAQSAVDPRWRRSVAKKADRYGPSIEIDRGEETTRPKAA